MRNYFIHFPNISKRLIFSAFKYVWTIEIIFHFPFPLQKHTQVHLKSKKTSALYWNCNRHPLKFLLPLFFPPIHSFISLVNDPHSFKWKMHKSNWNRRKISLILFTLKVHFHSVTKLILIFASFSPLNFHTFAKSFQIIFRWRFHSLKAL